MRDYLQEALQTFNGGNWYAWKKFDENGNKIPNNQRMCYECIEIIKDGATMPTKAEVDAKIQELKDAETDKETKKASGKQKLLDLGLTEEEVKALIGV
jgi:Ran GTPase-activating protein (RanGAP) involved in mRNA processing and transport